jgi:hypothetical protein
MVSCSLLDGGLFFSPFIFILTSNASATTLVSSIVYVYRRWNGKCYSASRFFDLLVIGVCPTHFQFDVDY